MLIVDFFAAFFTAITLENMFFTRAMDFPGSHVSMSSPQKIFSLGAVVTGVTTISGLLVYFLNLLIKPLDTYLYTGVLCYIGVNVAVYIVGYIIIKKWAPGLFLKIGAAMPLAAVNSVTLGSILISSRMSEYNVFLKFFAYNIGTGIGFTLALLVLWCISQKIMFSDVPKAFQGLPIKLITIGIVSLSVFGLMGNQLPA